MAKKIPMLGLIQDMNLPELEMKNMGKKNINSKQDSKETNSLVLLPEQMQSIKVFY